MDESLTHKWTEDEISALADRGYEFIATLNMYQTAGFAKDENEVMYVVKSLPNGSSELAVLETLLAAPSPRNHTLPVTFIPCANTTVTLSKQFLQTWYAENWVEFDKFLRLFRDIMEGLEFMHDLKIAHFDVDVDNIVDMADLGPADAPHRFWFVDFGSSRVLTKPPGVRPAEVDTEWFTRCAGHFPPPEGTDAIQPYAYDVWCLGGYFKLISRYMSGDGGTRTRLTQVPPSMLSFVYALTANDPERRPTVRQARRLYRLLECWVKGTRWMHWLLPTKLANRYDFCAWQVIRFMVYAACVKKGYL